MSKYLESMKGFLISDLERDGSVELFQQLSSLMPLTVQPAVWVTEEEMNDSAVVDQKRFEARHLRPPLAGEVGTALAHRSVCSQIQEQSGTWWLIFEDDAQILDGVGLVDRIEELSFFLDVDQACIVNLSHRAGSPLPTSRKAAVRGLWRPRTPTYTATAYLLNRKAAELIVEAQTPIQSQPDWPINASEVLFLQETLPIIQPNTEIVSIADPLELRSRVPKGSRFLIWSWIWYLQHRKFLLGPSEYWRSVLMPRLFRHLYRSY